MSQMSTKSTHDHLIDVGVKLMHRDGYHATGLSDILKAAGVPKGSFYHHFSSKEAFAAAALEKYLQREGEHVAAVLIDTKTAPLKRLRRYFSDLTKIYGQKGAVPGCMMGRFSVEIAAANPQIRRQISAAFARWQNTVATVLQQAVTEKELPPDTDPNSLAGFLLNSWQGAIVRSQAEKSDAPLDTFVHYALEGMLAKKSKAP